jgi:aryl-alcohol dehydrogenase-like predicted oxidoreductase
MRYHLIPKTRLRAARICLGTCFYGTAIPRDDAWAMLDTFGQQGGNWADSAHCYASWLPDGEGASERTLGGWVQARGVRQEFLIATKGGDPDLKAGGPPRLRPEEITHDLYESLERLGTDYVDLYWLHRDNPSVPVDEIIAILNEHRAAGRIREFGASNWTVRRQQDAAAYAGRHRLATFAAAEIGFSLAPVNRERSDHNVIFMDDGTLQDYCRTRIPVMAFSAQAEGWFSGKYGRNTVLSDTPQARRAADLYACEENLARLERAQHLAAQHGCSANQIALAYLLAQPFLVFPIVGCRNVKQVLDSCGATKIRLTPTEVAWLQGNYRQF